jgi:hypothetical protein
VGFTLLTLMVRSALADSDVPASGSEKESVAEQSARTLYPFSSLTLRNTWTTGRWNARDTANVLEIRSLTPLKLWEQQTLLRIVVPYRIKFPGGPGLGDARAFDLVVFKQAWGFWAVGPVVNLRAATSTGADTFQIGPAAGLVAAVDHRLGFGVLTQNLLSGHTAVTTFQPILAYQFNAIWSLGLGELPFVYDWNQGQFLFAPVGFQVGALVNAHGQWLRAFFNPQFNTKEIQNVSRWTLSFGLSFLSPAQRK